MSWATRATLILGIPWMLFSALIFSFPGQNLHGWLLGAAVLWGIPIGFVWIMLRLILGNAGSIRHH